MPSPWVGAGEGAIGGATSGAVASGGNPYVAGAGAIAGGVLGFLGASDNKGYELPWDQYNARLSQITDYSNQLNGATSQYANAINNMYSTAFNQYMPNAAAQFGARGLGIDSGAFGAELGRASAMYTAQGMRDVAGMNINNINHVESERGNAWGAMFGAANKSSEGGYENAQANMRGLGSAFTGLAGIGLMNRGGNGSPPSGSGGLWSTDYSIPMQSQSFDQHGNLMYGNGSPGGFTTGNPFANRNPLELGVN